MKKRIDIKCCDCDHYKLCYIGTIKMKRPGRWPKWPLPVLICNIGDTSDYKTLTLTAGEIKNPKGECKDFEIKWHKTPKPRKGKGGK